MNVLIINCHTANRGDEAAVRALVDELIMSYPDIHITLGMRGSTRYPNLPSNVTSISQLIAVKEDYKFWIAKATKGNVAIGRTYHRFLTAVRKSDLILHAPGGPSIGDTYYNAEASYLNVYDLLIQMKKSYMFYAPSMGPFNNTERNAWRRKILLNAKAIVLRDPISAKYVKGLVPEKQIYQTLDSAFQHDIDMQENKKKYFQFKELREFISRHNKCIGITITDLMWHPVWSKNPEMVDNIRKTFSDFIEEKTAIGYGIVFIPQLYGSGNDYNLMESYCKDKENCFVIPDNDDRYDTYFQQYLISKLYAVIGMRYHSNIFSAKMGTPFISVSYEQKMQGFMEKMNLERYCIPLKELSEETLREKYNILTKNYQSYKNYLNEKHGEMKADAYQTTEFVKKILKNK